MDGPDARPRPVVLVHGILGQRHLYWNLFRHRLERDGFTVHEAVLPYYLLGDLEEASAHLAREVRTLLAADISKADAASSGPAPAPSRVDLVCHSAGGLVARRALRELGPLVGHLVMMGTANQGTLAARPFAALPFLRFAQQTHPGSGFLEDLARDPVNPLRVHCVWSPVDGIVLPPGNATIPGADNVELPWTGHWMFLWSSSAYEAVRNILAKPAPP